MKMLKSKIHNMKVTAADKEYEGSVKVGRKIMRLAGLYPFEMVLINNQTTGSSWTTYVLPAKGDTDLILCGGAAFHGEVGHLYTILAFEEVEYKWVKPKMVIFKGDTYEAFIADTPSLEP